MRDRALLPQPLHSTAPTPHASFLTGVSARWGTRTLTAAAVLLAAIALVTLNALLQAPQLPATF